MIKSWQTRLFDESEALNEKLSRLYEFINSEEYEALDVEVGAELTVQAYFMNQYAAVLNSRLERLG